MKIFDEKKIMHTVGRGLSETGHDKLKLWNWETVVV